MRNVPESFTNRWLAGGPFFGDGKPVVRVTVEPDWRLRRASDAPGWPTEKQPLCWFQQDGVWPNQIEVPNIISLNFDESIDQDSSTFDLVLGNQQHYCNTRSTAVPRLGDPGHFSPYRSTTGGNAHWGAPDSEWGRILVENCLLRTYFGYGPDAETCNIQEGVNEGLLVLTGTWLADEVRPSGKSGELHITGRSMAKLLIDQRIFPPFAPDGQYPLNYYRWVDTYTTFPGNTSYGNPTSTTYISHGGVSEVKRAVDIAVHPGGFGYWILTNDGIVWSIGTENNGHPNASRTNIWRSISCTPSGRGYWTLDKDGTVNAFGDATHFGNVPAGQGHARKIRRTSTGNGYWILMDNGRVFTFGDAPYLGDVLGKGSTGDNLVDFLPTPTDGGYYIGFRNRTVWRFGDAPHGNQGNGQNIFLAPSSMTLAGMTLLVRKHCDRADDILGIYGFFSDQLSAPGAPVTAQAIASAFLKLSSDHVPPAERPTAMILHSFPLARNQLSPYYIAADSTENGFGLVLLSQDGKARSLGAVSAEGSVYSGYTIKNRADGNYLDYTDIVKDMLMWSGFYLRGTSPAEPLGLLESTGAYAEEALGKEIFDKASPMDAINRIREAIGYLFWIDHEGGANWISPNWVEPGNNLSDGSRTETIWELDESLNLIDWSPRYTDRSSRSEIIISSNDPEEASHTTITTRYTPPGVEVLRGMVKPAVWINGVFTKCSEQKTLAELVGQYAFFADRQGQAVVPYHPGVQINDQVWIYEKVSGEYAIHYVRGVSAQFDVDSGRAVMVLTTHKLGTPDRWATR